MSWTHIFWAAWAALTIAVWRHQYRTPPDDPDVEAAHMKAHLQRRYPENES